MSEIERILDNKPSRPPMISTLALRWQSICPHGSGGGSLEEAGSPKSEGGNSQDQEQTKEVSNKLPFCEIQWNIDGNVHLVAPVLSSPRTDTSSSHSLRSRRTSCARAYDTSRWQYLSITRVTSGKPAATRQRHSGTSAFGYHPLIGAICISCRMSRGHS